VDIQKPPRKYAINLYPEYKNPKGNCCNLLTE
jgi:hypothetical protein